MEASVPSKVVSPPSSNGKRIVTLFLAAERDAYEATVIERFNETLTMMCLG